MTGVETAGLLSSEEPTESAGPLYCAKESALYPHGERGEPVRVLK